LFKRGGVKWLGVNQDNPLQMDEAISAIRRTDAEMGLPYFIGLYAEALADCGRLDEARKTVEAALDLSRTNGTYFQLADILRIKACIRERGRRRPEESCRYSTRRRTLPLVNVRRLVGLRVATELARGPGFSPR
jgi:hypothetical protein